MHPKSVSEFIENIDESKLQDLYDKTYNKVQNLENRTKTLITYTIIIILLYFISSNVIIESFQIGPVSISDISVMTKLFPIIFSYLIYELVANSAHKSEVNSTLSFIFFKINKTHIDDKKTDRNLSRIFLPYATWNEALRINIFGKIGCFFISIIILLPIFSLIILPIYFEYILLKDLFLNYFNDAFGKISFFLSLWLSFISLWYFVFLMINNFKENKKNNL